MRLCVALFLLLLIGLQLGVPASADTDHIARVRLPEISIGPMTFMDSDVLAPPASAFSGHDGAIGYDLLSLFTVDLDYAHERVYLTPNAYGKSSTRPVK